MPYFALCVGFHSKSWISSRSLTLAPVPSWKLSMYVKKNPIFWSVCLLWQQARPRQVMQTPPAMTGTCHQNVWNQFTQNSFLKYPYKYEFIAPSLTPYCNRVLQYFSSNVIACKTKSCLDIGKCFSHWASRHPADPPNHWQECNAVSCNSSPHCFVKFVNL